MASSAGVSTVLFGALGPIGASAVVVRLRHFFTVFGFTPLPVPPAPGSHFVKRSDARACNLMAIQGVRMANRWRFLEWDSAERRARPIDLTGAKVEFTIRRRPAYAITLGALPPDGTEA